MGYCMDQEEHEFFIPVDKLPAMVAAIQSLHGDESISDSGGRHFSWVDQDFYLHDDPVQILCCWRWRPELDNQGNIDAIYFEGEKFGDDEVLFNTVAPFVRKGSYIEMRGEDGALWRWNFDGERMIERGAEISWGDPDENPDSDEEETSDDKSPKNSTNPTKRAEFLISFGSDVTPAQLETFLQKLEQLAGDMEVEIDPILRVEGSEA